MKHRGGSGRPKRAAVERTKARKEAEEEAKDPILARLKKAVKITNERVKEAEKGNARMAAYWAEFNAKYPVKNK
jgi:hypothetical protein